MNLRTAGSIACVLSSLVGCRDKGKLSPEKSAPQGPVSSATGSAPATPRPAEPPSNTAEASALPPPPAPPPATIRVSDVALEPVLAADARCDYVLHSPRGAVLVAQCTSLSLLKDGKLESTTLPETGLGVNHVTQEESAVNEIHRVSGRWPDSLVIEVTRLDQMMSDRGAYFVPEEAAYELVGGRWREVLGEPVTQAGAWSQGRTLVYRGGRFELMAGRKDLGMPEPTWSQGSCGREVAVDDFAAMADGTVVSAGDYCNDHDDLRAEIIDEGKPGVVYKLRTATLLRDHAPLRVVGESRDALFVSAPALKGVVFWRYHDGAFEEMALPSQRPLATAHVTADGYLWLTFSGPSKERGKAEPAQVFRRAPAGFWESIALPDPKALRVAIAAQIPAKNAMNPAPAAEELRFLPTSVASFAEGEVWVAGSVLTGVDRQVATVLARSSSAASVSAPEVGARRGPDVPEPYRDGCESPFVILYAVGDKVPADYDFPSTRDALRGSRFLTSARFVEFRYKEKRTLGALVANGGEGKALIARLEAGVRGSKPALMCFAPKTVERQVSLK